MQSIHYNLPLLPVKNRMKIIVCTILLLVSGYSFADFESPRAEAIKLTVYRDDTLDEYYEFDSNGASDAGLVMITETRSVELEAGSNTIVFYGVADGIIPQTAKLEDVNGAIIESNFDYNLMTPDELFVKSINKPVKIQRAIQATGEMIEKTAVIRSSENGIVLEIDGKFESLNCSGEIEKIVFPSIPPELVKEPTLSVIINARSKGSYPVKLSYLAVGIQWKANYVATVNSKNNTMDLMAWVTLVNARSSNFANVPIQVIAGKVEINSSITSPPNLRKPKIITKCWPDLYEDKALTIDSDEYVEEVIVTGFRASVVKAEEFADYKLYSFPQKTTLSAYQNKQVMLLSQKNIPFKSRYQYTFSIDDIISDYKHRHSDDDVDDNKYPTLQLTTKNILKNNLGTSLPEGEVAIQELHGDSAVLIGEDKIRDIPVGLMLNLELEETPDILVNINVLEYEDKKDIIQLSLEFEIDNRKSKKIDFQLQQHIPEGYSLLKVIDESVKRKLEYGRLTWSSSINARTTKKIKMKLKLQELD